MFFTYLGRELRRRSRQALVIALAVALGIGLVIAVSAASSGAKSAQASVAKSLYGIGTDITVTQPAKQGSGGPQQFGITGPSQSGAGTKTATASQDTARVAPGTGTITSATLTKIKGLSGVSGAVGSLSLVDFNISGALQQTVTQAPSTSGSGSGSGSSGRGFGGGGGGGGGGFGQAGGRGSFRGSFSQTTVEGLDVTDGSIGPITSLTLSSGRMIAAADAKSAVAVVNSSYATQNSVKVGSTETLGGTKFTVVGIVTTSESQDYFIPLTEAQTISKDTGDVTTVYVKAASNTQINTVADGIKTAASGSTVSTTADLASSVSGSLGSTASLINNLGRWLSIGVLIAAFLVAALFTLSSVSRRTREIGTLKAIGWTSRRVVRQVLGESIVTGLIGGALGIGLGYLGAFIIQKTSPSLTASAAPSTASNTAGGAFAGGGGNFGGGGGGGGGGGAARAGGFAARAAGNDVTVHLTAPVSITVLLIAVGLAVLGGLIAGGLGGWRASSLRPADALAKVA